MSFDALEREFLALISRSASEIEDALALLVDVSSATGDVAGVDEVGRHVLRWLAEAGFREEVVRVPGVGAHRIARRGETGPAVLLVGHVDTVYPEGHPVGSFRVDPDDPDRLLGPGVTDMKGGLVVMVSALRALARAGALDGKRITVVLSADEEAGSPTARDLIAREARVHDLALVFETGSARTRTRSTLVTERKGVGRARIEIRGIESHAGARKDEGLSAALEMAHKIIALEALDDPANGTTVNVGVARSGTTANTVPGTAVLEIDYRFRDEKAGRAVEVAMRRIAEEASTRSDKLDAAPTGSIVFGARNPPMLPGRRTRAAAERVRAAAADLDLELEDEARGGASDGNITAAEGCPTVDGLGSVGGAIHSPDEWVQRSSLVDRSRLLALFLHRFDGLPR